MGYTNLKGTTAGNVGLLDGCNGSDPFACRTALRNNIDLYWCDDWKKYGYTKNGDYKLFHSQAWNVTTKKACHMSSSPPYSAISTRSTGSYIIRFTGNYYMYLQGGGKGISSWDRSGYGGKVSATKTFTAGTKLIGVIANGGWAIDCGRYGCTSGHTGYGLYIGTRTEKNLALVAGGGGCCLSSWDDPNPCSSGGWLTDTDIGSSGCTWNGKTGTPTIGTTIRPAGRLGSVGIAPERGKSAVTGSGNAGGWRGNGAGGCPSIYSPYPSLVSNCNYTSPLVPYGSGGGINIYAIGRPSGFTPPPKP